MMPALKHATALRREFTAAQRIPYRAHVAPGVVRTESGDYLQAFRLGGASFETSDDAQLNNWHERLNVLWRNIATPGVALWTHVIRRRASVGEMGSERGADYRDADDTGAADRGSGRFAAELHRRYWLRLGEELLMHNELYLAVLYRPVAGRASGLLSRAIAKTQRDALRTELADALDACEKLAQTLAASLARYEPEPLGCYRHGRLWCSSLLEYLALLLNGERCRMPLPRGPLHRCLANTRLFFGTEVIECRSAHETRVAAILGIKEYPTPTVAGMYDRLLSSPIIENCGNTLILRCSGSENGGTSQFASRLIGEREVLRRQVSRGSDRDGAWSSRGARRSKNTSEQHVTEAAVMPSEIEQLPDFTGYLKTASSPAWLKVAFDRRSFLPGPPHE
jgi:type IV secretion system protein VirB4